MSVEKIRIEIISGDHMGQQMEAAMESSSRSGNLRPNTALNNQCDDHVISYIQIPAFTPGAFNRTSLSMLEDISPCGYH